jgi:hypothetical protein
MTSGNAQLTVVGNITAGIGATGIYASSGSAKITVTGDITVADGSMGLYSNGAEIEFEGKIETGVNGYGAYSQGSSDVTIKGDISCGDNSRGVFAFDTAEVNVIGNITVGNNGEGVFAYGDEDTVTINGNITVGDGTVGIAANDGASVVITGNIVGGDGSCGVFAIDMAVVEVTGNIIVGGDGYGVQANGGKVTVDGNITVSGSITDDEYGSHGIQAGGGAEIVVTGNIKINGDGIGVFSTGSADVTVEKDIEVNAGDDIVESHGIWAGGGKVTVEGNITVGDCGLGVLANDDSEVIVRGDITTGINSTGIDASGTAVVEVDGSIFTGGDRSFGISAADEAYVTVKGDLTVGDSTDGDNCFGIHAWNDSVVTVEGNVTVIKGYGVDSGVGDDEEGGVTITIKGDLIIGDGIDDVFIALWVDEEGTEFEFEGFTDTEDGYWIYTDGISTVRLLIPVYEISLNANATEDFGSMTVGYGTAPAAHTITVTNAGNRETGELTIELSGTGAESFTAPPSIPNMAVPGTADFTIVPKTGLAVGVHTATVTVFNTANEISESFTVKFEVTVTPEYSISLDPTSKDFDSKTVGYGGLTPFEVTVTNTGNQPTGGLTLSLTGDDDAFYVDLTMASIAVDGTGTFNVTPKNGLAVGEYTATVTVSGANGISKEFEISFTVEEAEGLSMIVIISIAVAAIAVIGAAAWYLLFGRK